MNDPFARLGYLIMRFRWVIFLLWLVLMPIAVRPGGVESVGLSQGWRVSRRVIRGRQSRRRAGEGLRRLEQQHGGRRSLHSATLTTDDAAFKDEVVASGSGWRLLRARGAS